MDEGNYFSQFVEPPSGGGGDNYFSQFVQPPEPSQPQSQQPEENYFSQFVQPQEPEAEGKLGTAAREAVHGVIPGAGGWAGAAAGIAAGAALGAPEGGFGAIPGALIGGVLGYLGTSKAQESGLNALGFDDSMQRAVNAKTNPLSALAGEVGSQLPFVGAGAATRGARAIGAGFGAGLEGVNQVSQGEFDPLRLAGAAGAGALLTKPTALGDVIGSRTASALGRPGAWTPHGTAGSNTAGWHCRCVNRRRWPRTWGNRNPAATAITARKQHRRNRRLPLPM